MPSLKIRKNNIFFTLIVLTSIFLLDRISKFLVIKKVKELGSTEIFSSKFINFELIWNKGIAFGLLSFNHNMIYQLITLVIVLVVMILFFFIFKSESYERLGFILITGGALGNLYDRLTYKAVPDFIDLHIDNLHWFIFNIADIFITIGIICLILVEIFIKRKA